MDKDDTSAAFNEEDLKCKEIPPDYSPPPLPREQLNLEANSSAHLDEDDKELKDPPVPPPVETRDKDLNDPPIPLPVETMDKALKDSLEPTPLETSDNNSIHNSSDEEDEESKRTPSTTRRESGETPSTTRRESPTNENLTDTADKFQKNFSSSRAFGGRGLDDTDAPEEKKPPEAKEPPEADDDNNHSNVTSACSSYNNSMKEYPIVTTPDPDPVEHRGQWGNHCEYFLTSLGLAVGLGNIWRFPFQVYENGGSTFMIPYFIMLFLVGLPMFLMEMILGQYTGTSATKVYARMAPGLKGLGYGMLAIPTIINFYYTIIMAWAFFYMFSGFTDVLPWKFCGKEYNSINCFSRGDDINCRNDTSTTFWNNSCTEVDVFCQWHGWDFFPDNYTHCFNLTAHTEIPLADVTVRISSGEEFFNKRMLKLGEIGVESTWENYGDIQWEIVGCLALSWTLIALSLIKGVSSYGKAAYFITLFPYVVLITLFVIISQEDGFVDGVEFYMLNPDWARLGSDITVWMAAAGQIFYSLGIAVGSQLLLASYNDFNSNCHRDAILIGLFNSLTSIFGGFVVFGILGVLANKNQVAIEAVVQSGTGLAFIAYPDAVADLEGAVSPLISFMFFFMLVLLALSSVAATWEPTVAAIIDEFPALHKYRPFIMVASCVFAFLCGISCCFQSGIFMFDMMDNRTSNAIVIMGLIELVVLWCYGLDRFFDNIDEMKIWMPTPLKWFWKTCWGLITPGVILAVMINNYIEPMVDHYLDYTYPDNIQVLGWFMELSPVVLVFLVSIGIVIYNYLHGGPVAFLRAGPLMSPSAAWGPREDRPRAAHQGVDSIKLYMDVNISDDIPKTTL